MILEQVIFQYSIDTNSQEKNPNKLRVGYRFLKTLFNLTLLIRFSFWHSRWRYHAEANV